jgi:hypothetical protein
LKTIDGPRFRHLALPVKLFIFAAGDALAGDFGAEIRPARYTVEQVALSAKQCQGGWVEKPSPEND